MIPLVIPDSWEPVPTSSGFAITHRGGPGDVAATRAAGVLAARRRLHDRARFKLSDTGSRSTISGDHPRGPRRAGDKPIPIIHRPVSRPRTLTDAQNALYSCLPNHALRWLKVSEAAPAACFQADQGLLLENRYYLGRYGLYREIL